MTKKKEQKVAEASTPNTDKIKKPFMAIVALLLQDTAQPISFVIDDILVLCSKSTSATRKKGKSNTTVRDTEGNVVAIMDYCFKRWMPLVGELAVEFGSKAGSATGLSNMSKAGTSAWTHAQLVAKKAMTAILVDVESGELDISAISDTKNAIEEARKAVPVTDLGFESKEELLAYLLANDVEVEAQAEEVEQED